MQCFDDWVFNAIFRPKRPNRNHVRDETRLGDLPQPLNLANRRPITPSITPISTSKKDSPNIDPTLGSLGLLPLEVRQQIYEEVLAGHTFHLRVQYSYRKSRPQLTSEYCLSTDFEKCDTERGVHTCRVGLGDYLPPPTISGLLSLLLTCKHMWVNQAHGETLGPCPAFCSNQKTSPEIMLLTSDKS